jgi:hypothetical protein
VRVFDSDLDLDTLTSMPFAFGARPGPKKNRIRSHVAGQRAFFQVLAGLRRYAPLGTNKSCSFVNDRPTSLTCWSSDVDVDGCNSFKVPVQRRFPVPGLVYFRTPMFLLQCEILSASGYCTKAISPSPK